MKIFRCLIPMALAWLAPGPWGARAQDAGAPPVDRDVLSRWIETRRILSMERSDWRVGRELLAERLAMLKRERDDIQEKSARLEGEIRESDAKLEELRKKNDTLKLVPDALSQPLADAERRLTALLDRLPPPIRERVQPLARRIPSDAAASGQSIAERMQNLIGILNEVNKFSREVLVTTEARALPDGTTAEVTVIYFGFGHAYYTNLRSGVAGVGRAGKEAWEWAPDNALAQAVADVIAIYRNEAPAVYISLPVSIPSHKRSTEGIAP